MVPILLNILHATQRELPVIFFIGGLSSILGSFCLNYALKYIKIILLMFFISSCHIININAIIFYSIFMFFGYSRLILVSIQASFFSKNNNRVVFSSMQTMLMNISSLITFLSVSLFINKQSINLIQLQSLLVISIVMSILSFLYVVILEYIKDK